MDQKKESGNKISVSISEELLEKIDAMAKAEKRSRAAMIAILLEEEMVAYKPIDGTTPKE